MLGSIDFYQYEYKLIFASKKQDASRGSLMASRLVGWEVFPSLSALSLFEYQIPNSPPSSLSLYTKGKNARFS